MKITCEHCGTVIDTEKDKKCPSCHAPYSDNKEYKEVKDYKKKDKDYDFREREADIRKKEITNSIMEKQMDTAKKLTFIPVIIFVFIAVVSIFVFRLISAQIKDSSNIHNNNDNTNIKDNINDMKDTIDEFKGEKQEETAEEEKNISFKENAIMNKYEIKCDDVREYKYDWYEKGTYRPKDLKYYAFHLVFKNTSNESLILSNNIQLTYTDNKGNKDINAKKHVANQKESANSLEFFAKSNSNYSGNAFFEIPNYVKDVKIKYDKVTITIKDFRKK